MQYPLHDGDVIVHVYINVFATDALLNSFAFRANAKRASVHFLIKRFTVFERMLR